MSQATRHWIAGGLAVLAVMLIAGTASPIRRALEVHPASRLSPSGIAAATADRVAHDARYPLTGVGVGSYRVLSPDYWRAMANDALPLDNAQNWWRHQIAELGVFGGALVIAFSVAGGVAGPAGARSVRTRAASTVAGSCSGSASTSFFGMPTQNPVVL